MKYFFLSILFFSLASQVTAQNSNRISFFYAFSSNDLLRNEGLDGAPSYDGRGSDIFGFSYQRFLNEILSLETGIEYSKNKIEITPNFYPDIDMTPNKVTIEMFTIPIYTNFNFLKYFYANAGLLIDFEVNRDEYPKTDEQSGVGFGGGIGVQYTLQNFTLYINPMIRYHAVIAFQKENYQQHITEAGVKFGIGYNF